MLLLTIAAVVAVTLVLEVGFSRAFPKAWRAGRWVLVPPVGGLVGATVPMGAVGAVVADQWASLALGVALASLVAVWGAFSDALWRHRPSEPPVTGAALRARVPRSQQP